MLLVVTVNSNYAVTVGLCAMGMDHDDECCCTHSTVPEGNIHGAYFTKADDCCSEITTEYSNNADFENIKRIENSELVFLFSVCLSDIFNSHVLSSSLYLPEKIPISHTEDIPIKHSSLLI